MSYHDQQDSITNYSEIPILSASGPSAVKQQRGEFASNGTQHSFGLELDISTVEHGWYGNMMNGIGAVLGAFGSVPCIVCCPNPYKPVNQGSVGLISRFGKFYKCVDPGLVKMNPVTETIKRVNIRMQIEEIPEQLIMTKDNVTVSIDSVLYWHIIDPYQAQFGVSNVVKALVERTQTTLRHILGGKVLQDCVENREAIATEVQEITSRVATEWGVRIESILIKDFKFSTELQQSLSAAAQAKRIGESKVISAKAEVDSAKLMREAADILSTPSAMQIRYLDTLNNLSKAPNTKVFFLPSTEGGEKENLSPFNAQNYVTMSNS
ncbi:hypothetical protein BDB01DRAFT_790772 [Pilobolus umbonatus]|nr:hypothetical protein BDB01DRAFT_790772 [Pilobolus umbonatus]